MKYFLRYWAFSLLSLRAFAGDPTPLDLSGGFNYDGFISNAEATHAMLYNPPADWGLARRMVNHVFGEHSSSFLSAGNNYAWQHQVPSGGLGLPDDGIVTTNYGVFQLSTLLDNVPSGGYTQVPPPTNPAGLLPVAANMIRVFRPHSNVKGWSSATASVTLPSAQQTYYEGVNFLVSGSNGKVRIFADYDNGQGGINRVLIYESPGVPKTSSETGFPDMTATTSANPDIVAVPGLAMTHRWGQTSDYSAVRNSAARLWTFAQPLPLDPQQKLRGFTLAVHDDDLYKSRSAIIYAASAVSAIVQPVANAGGNQTVVDVDRNGSEPVQLDGSASTGSIQSYVWTRAGEVIATGPTPQVVLSQGIHDIQLTVSGYGLSDSAFIRIVVMPKADFFVDINHPQASDSNPGTEALPWRTIQRAVNGRQPGDVIVVKEGIYRERVTLKTSGAPSNPITLMAQPFHRVIVTGADEITDWWPATSEIVKGNPNWANIYYTDLDWRPIRLVQDGVTLEQARHPNVGWYLATGGSATTLIDTVNLTQPDDYWVGAEVFYWRLSGTSQFTRKVTAFNAATSTLTVNSSWTAPSANDRYILRNKIEILDREGEWAVENFSGGNGTIYRVFVWPRGGTDPNTVLMEGARRDRFVIEWGNYGHWVFDGLEIRHGASHGIGGWSSGNPGGIIVRNCSVHSNEGGGIYGRFNEKGIYRRNFVGYNSGVGITVSDRGNVLVEENEVMKNGTDGIVANGNGTVVRRNYVHHHVLWAHPDNMQTFGNITNLTIEGNLLLAGGQGYMMEQLDGIVFRNNTILGSAAYMLIFGHSNTYNATLENNTLCWSGYGITSMTATGYTYRNNICVKGQSGILWGANATMGYQSDYNLFWHTDGMTSYPVGWNGNQSMTLAQYSAASGQDTHSLYAGPQFVNTPRSFYRLAFGKYHTFPTNRIYIGSNEAANMAELQVGDIVEVDFDGIPRIVIAKGSDWVDVDPGDERLAWKYSIMANWKNNSNFQLDLSLKPTSPAIGAAQGGGNLGSTINVPQFMAGDFDGDGVRDIPTPPFDR